MLPEAKNVSVLGEPKSYAGSVPQVSQRAGQVGMGMLKTIWRMLNTGRQAGPEQGATTITIIPSNYGSFQTYLQDWAHGICRGTSQCLAELVEGLQVSLEERV